MKKFTITGVTAREILDCRWNPTVQVDVLVNNEILGRADVPAGRSTGTNEAKELRDKEKRYDGMGVRKAVENINEVLGPEIIGMDVTDQRKVDEKLRILDGTKNKSRLGANAIVALLQRKPDAVLGLATGSSPMAIYDELVRRRQSGEVSFAQARAFTLDEYVGRASDHRETYHNVIRRDFVDRVDFAPAAVHGPDGLAADLPAVCHEYEEAIVTAGGVDLQILGIGTDGHIGFNEPSSSFSAPDQDPRHADPHRQRPLRRRCRPVPTHCHPRSGHHHGRPACGAGSEPDTARPKPFTSLPRARSARCGPRRSCSITRMSRC